MDENEKRMMKNLAIFLLGMAAMYMWLMANNQIVALL